MEHLSTNAEMFHKISFARDRTRAPQFWSTARALQAPTCKPRTAKNNFVRNKLRPKMDTSRQVQTGAKA